MARDFMKLTIGALGAMLLLAFPVLAAQDQGGTPQQQQASPSQKPAGEAKTESVDPGAVGKAPMAGPQATGNAQAETSETRAPQATPHAVEAKPQTKNPETR